MKTHSKLIFILSLVWLLTACLRFLFYHELNDVLWMLTFLVDGAFLLFGLGLAIALVCLRSLTSIISSACLLAFAGAFFFTSVGWKTGTLFRFWRLQSQYEQQVAEILQLPDVEAEGRKGSVIVDLGPPRRIAFSWGGIIDNWTGIVYDPSGEVLKAQNFKEDWSNWDDPSLQHVRRLFGGDLRSAWHLWGPWYYCAFT